MRLHDKVAIVTGATRGIGEAIARQFASEGATVVLADILPAGEQVAADLRVQGSNATFVLTNVAEASDISKLVEFTVKKYGRIDILCNNAGVNIPGSVVELTEAQWDTTMNVNVKSMFLTCKYAIPEMVKTGGGSIVNMASANSFVAEPRLNGYVTSKGAILMFTKQVALDVADLGIRCNCICPGWVDTTFNDAHANLFGGRDVILTELKDIQPIGRPIQPEEIAKIALFLASDDSSSMTGSAILADGGVTAK